jgi:hypothetical protein
VGLTHIRAARVSSSSLEQVREEIHVGWDEDGRRISRYMSTSFAGKDRKG